MNNPSFMTDLLNTLKNKRRLQILETLSKGRRSIVNLQQELKKLGYFHSQKTIAQEYIAPLIQVGLAEESQNRYYATVLGCRFTNIIRNFSYVEGVLPPHSKCYEETALSMLLNKPRTYEDFEDMIPAKSTARVLSRLQKAGLVETSKENDYIYYFRTKRDQNKTKFSPTEKRIYENIPAEGISAQKLSEKTGISVRRTYKYLRRLKGKKLVFTRKKPKSYTLSDRGMRITSTLAEIHNLVMETLATITQFVKGVKAPELLMPGTSHKTQGKQIKEVAPLTTLQHIKQD